MLNAELNVPILRLTLDKPEVRNAFNDELIKALTTVFESVSPDVRTIILRASPPAFCGGGDLQWMQKAADYTEEENYEDALKLAKLFQLIVNCPPVVICAVEGAAFGGGCGLVAASDVAIATPNATFAFSEVRLGLIPATIAPIVVPKIGAGNARYLFTTGETFGAEVALRIGLIHEIVAPENLQEAINVKISSVLRNGATTIVEARKLALEQPLTSEESAHRLAAARASEEGREGVGAFLQKRKANFVAELP